MENLPNEILTEIIKLLNDLDKLAFAFTNKTYSSFMLDITRTNLISNEINNYKNFCIECKKNIFFSDYFHTGGGKYVFSYDFPIVARVVDQYKTISRDGCYIHDVCLITTFIKSFTDIEKWIQTINHTIIDELEKIIPTEEPFMYPMKHQIIRKKVMRKAFEDLLYEFYKRKEKKITYFQEHVIKCDRLRLYDILYWSFEDEYPLSSDLGPLPSTSVIKVNHPRNT